MTSWTITDSVLYPCRLSPKHHHEVPKLKEKWKNPPGRQTSVVLALILSSVLLKLLMTQRGTKTAHWLIDLDCVYCVYLTHLWSDCEWIALHRRLLCTSVGCRLSELEKGLGGKKSVYIFQSFLTRATFLKLHWADGSMKSSLSPACLLVWGLLIVCGAFVWGNTSLLMCTTQVKC